MLNGLCRSLPLPQLNAQNSPSKAASSKEIRSSPFIPDSQDRPHPYPSVLSSFHPPRAFSSLDSARI